MNDSRDNSGSIPLSVYIHFPWCEKKCPYCDFNSHPKRGGVPQTRYLKALLDDLDQDATAVSGRRIESVFIGGGTPSLFDPDSVGRLLEDVRARLPCGESPEVTIEANPGSADAGRFAGYRAAGVNRLSIGIQSFQDDMLGALGRIHGRAEAVRAVEMAHRAGFGQINLDLMFGLPGQTIDLARDDLERALYLEPTHISYYQLTVEPNTHFHHHPPVLPHEDISWEIQTRGHELLQRHGFERYEVSAFARPADECRHNRNYWEFGDYLGLGAGAHAKLTGVGGEVVRTWKQRHPEHFMAAAATAARVGGRQVVTQDEVMEEFFLNVLRLTRGVPKRFFEERTGLSLTRVESGLGRAVEDGLLRPDGKRIVATELGTRFLNDLVLRLVRAGTATRRVRQ